MKKILLIIVLGIVMCSVCCTSNETGNAILVEIGKCQFNETLFADIQNIAEIDEECQYILKVKKAIDETRLRLINTEDMIGKFSQLSNIYELRKCLYMMQAVPEKFMVCSELFMNHNSYLVDLFNEPADKVSQYAKLKYAIIKCDATIIEVGKSVLEAQEEFRASAKNFNFVLAQVLEQVTKNDIVAAAALLNSKDAIEFRMSMAKLLNEFYQFESSRAESVMDVYNLYKDVN